VANYVVAITKNGVQRLAAPPALDVAKYKTENKITDEEILKILEEPVAKAAKPPSSKPKSKKKKKKPATAKKAEAESEDEDDED